MKNKVIDILIEMGIPADNCGFQYIVDAMELLQQKEWRYVKLTALYHKIGIMNNVTISRVERGMRTAFAAAYQNGSEEMIKKYLSTQNRTNGNLLYILYYRILQGGNDEQHSIL